MVIWCVRSFKISESCFNISHEDSFKGDVFYKVRKSGDVFLGLPTKYIQRPEKEEVDRIDVEGSSFGNTMDFMCQCIELDDCGIHLTRQQLRDRKKSDPDLEKAELPVRTRKATKLPKIKVVRRTN